MIRAAAILALPIGLGLASVATGSLALFAGALGAVLLYLTLVVSLAIAARRARVIRTIDRHEAIEGHPIAMRFAVTRVGPLPVHVELRGADGRWRPLDRTGDEEPVVVDRPGAHMLGPSPLRVRDDLGLMAWRLARGGEPQALLILPRPEPPPALVTAGGAQHLGDTEPDGLRPYLPGTPMSRIHWPSAARGAELQERHVLPARDRLPLVVVDLAGAPGAEAIDWAARAAAGYVLAFVRGNGCRVALPGDRTPSLVTDPASDWPRLHRRLAALDDLAASGATPFAAGDADRDAITIRAAAAPAAALQQRGPLPPAVAPLAHWAEQA